MLKSKVEPDPDNNPATTNQPGVNAPKTTQVIYDDSGRTVANKVNSDPWTCITYDTRGRVTNIAQPDINGRAGRTVATTYSYQSNPLKTQSVDSVAGTTEAEIDLLGRTISSKDTFNNTTTIAYDNLGRVNTQVSPLGTETYEYDNLGRLTTYKLDNTTYATVAYDSYSRIQTVDYPQATDGTNNLKLEQIKRDSLLRTSGAVFRFSNNTAFDETLTKATSGVVTSQTDAYNASTVTNTYTYDRAGRLTEAVVDKNKYNYSYSAQNSTTCNQTGANQNSNKNSNRTAYTLTNTVTNQVVSQAVNCYNYADQLTYTTDTQIGTPTYDDHGNTISLAGGGTPITLTYDAADQNTAITQGGNKVEYVKSASGSVLRKKEYENNTLVRSYRFVAGGTVMQSCSLTDETNCTTTDKYLSLPGGVLLTLSPNNPQTAQQTVYSIKNFHSDTAMTANANGNPTSSVFLYEPFGQSSQSATFNTGSNPQNSSTQPMGWAASPTRKQEQLFTLSIMQMGARVYLPTQGRFLQTDPIEGGTANAYVYAGDPVNGEDYSGRYACVLQCTVSASYLQPAATIAQVQPAASGSTIQSTYSNIQRSRASRTAPRGAQAISSKRGADPNSILTLRLTGANKVAVSLAITPGGPTDRPVDRSFKWVGALSSAMDYYNGGTSIGIATGCALGAIGTAEFGGVGCLAGAPVYAAMFSWVFAAVGFLAGGFEWPNANAFEGWPGIDKGSFLVSP